jgi:mono/diheme cytochrome c family protein
MTTQRHSGSRSMSALVGLAGLVAALAAGCGAVGRVTSGDAAAGKKLFQEKCGSCHTLADAGTSGTIGPNLDNAFMSDKAQGFSESTMRDLVRGQIAYPESDPGTGHPGMTPNLLRGQQARDVAVYVAQCAAVPKCKISG